MSFRLATVDDYLDLGSSGFKCSTYKNLAYPLGCSQSELDAALGDGDFVVLSETTKVGFLRIRAVFEGIAYIDVHLLCDSADENIKFVMNWLARNYSIGKYYVQLLPHEQQEIDCLKRLGFTEEARLRDQLFVEGAYYDLLMLGSEDQRV